MAKMNSPIRGSVRGGQSKVSNNQMVSRGQAEGAVERTFLTLFLASSETLVEDFNFDKEQLLKFQELVKLKFQKKKLEIEHSLKNIT